jgi:hypothetical protein
MKKFFDKNGRQVDENEALDHRGTIRDGFRMLVPLTMMDSAPEWDGTRVAHPLTDAEAADFRRETRDQFRPLTDDEKIANIDARNAKLSEAWRNPTPLADTRTPLTETRTDIYDRYDQRVQDAWR